MQNEVTMIVFTLRVVTDTHATLSNTSNSPDSQHFQKALLYASTAAKHRNEKRKKDELEIFISINLKLSPPSMFISWVENYFGRNC